MDYDFVSIPTTHAHNSTKIMVPSQQHVGPEDKGSYWSNLSAPVAVSSRCSTTHRSSHLTSSVSDPFASNHNVPRATSSLDATRRLQLAQIAPPPLLLRSASSNASLSSLSTGTSASTTSSSSSPLLSDTAVAGSCPVESEEAFRRAKLGDGPSAEELDRQLSLYRGEISSTARRSGI